MSVSENRSLLACIHKHVQGSALVSFCLWDVIWCYHCNWSTRWSFPARQDRNCDDSLFLTAAVRRWPDRLHCLSHSLPHSSTNPSFLSNWALLPLQKSRDLPHPSLAPWPQQVGWKIQINNAVMRKLNCLMSCNEGIFWLGMEVYWKIYWTGNGERRETECCCVHQYCRDIKEKGAQ